MEKQKQAWHIEYEEEQWWFVLGEYWVNANIVKLNGIKFWVSHIRQKRPAWDWNAFEKIVRSHFTKEELGNA
jgi:hypothetical protein